jgi:hypothetical protein
MTDQARANNEDVRLLAETVFSFCMVEFSTDLIHKKGACDIAKAQIESLIREALEKARKEALTEVLTVSPEEAEKMALDERAEYIEEAVSAERDRLKDENFKFALTIADYEQIEMDLQAENKHWNEIGVKLLKERDRLREAIRNAMNELGVPQPDYPAPISNAYNILAEALKHPEGEGK